MTKYNKPSEGGEGIQPKEMAFCVKYGLGLGYADFPTLVSLRPIWF